MTWVSELSESISKQSKSSSTGYNDVSWHNPDIISPNLEKLANDGIKLEQAYVQPICTPTRSALMTGYYPIHTGRQVTISTPVMLYWLEMQINSLLHSIQYYGPKSLWVSSPISH